MVKLLSGETVGGRTIGFVGSNLFLCPEATEGSVKPVEVKSIRSIEHQPGVAHALILLGNASEVPTSLRRLEARARAVQTLSILSEVLFYESRSYDPEVIRLTKKKLELSHSRAVALIQDLLTKAPSDSEIRGLLEALEEEGPPSTFGRERLRSW